MASKKSAQPGSDRPYPRALTFQRDKAKASVKPVTSPGLLKGIWDREFGVYRVLIVEVLARRGPRLTFRLQGNAPRWNAPGRYSVDLDDGHVVWGDLPSTAQLVNLRKTPRARFGYLLLNENWIREHLQVEVPRGPGFVPAPGLPAVVAADAAPGGDPPKVPYVWSL